MLSYILLCNPLSLANSSAIELASDPAIALSNSSSTDLLSPAISAYDSANASSSATLSSS